MKKNNNWEFEAEKALDSLNGIRRAEANPYLYTRIMARLEEKRNSWVRVMNFLSRPVVAVGITTLFISLNALVAIQHPVAHEPTATVQSERDLGFDAEYATVNYSLLDINSNDK